MGDRGREGKRLESGERERERETELRVEQGEERDKSLEGGERR